MRVFRTIIGLVMMSALVGCDEASTKISFDHPLENALITARDSDQPARLRDLTDFDWDEVHLFNEGAPRESVEQVVGTRIFQSDVWESKCSLMVFESAGEVVRVLCVTGDYLRADKPTWASEVNVVPWGPGALRLQDGA